MTYHFQHTTNGDFILIANQQKRIRSSFACKSNAHFHTEYGVFVRNGIFSLIPTCSLSKTKVICRLLEKKFPVLEKLLTHRDVLNYNLQKTCCSFDILNRISKRIVSI